MSDNHTEQAEEDDLPPGDPNTALTPEFVAYYGKVRTWLRQYGLEDTPCPSCGHNSWLITPAVDTPIRFPEMGKFYVGKSVPLTPVICQTCGFIRWFNALKIGALDKAEGHNPDAKAEGA